MRNVVCTRIFIFFISIESFALGRLLFQAKQITTTATATTTTTAMTKTHRVGWHFCDRALFIQHFSIHLFLDWIIENHLQCFSMMRHDTYIYLFLRVFPSSSFSSSSLSTCFRYVYLCLAVFGCAHAHALLCGFQLVLTFSDLFHLICVITR